MRRVPAERTSSNPRDIRDASRLDEPIVAAPGGGIWRDYWLAIQHRQGRPAKVSFEAATVESELQAVASGKGISITSESTGNYYARPGVVFRPIDDMPECVIAIGFRPTPNSLVADFIQLAKLVAEKRIRPEPPAGRRLPSTNNRNTGYRREVRRYPAA
jgi:DNA-binding transcriptional LysR family regulator